MKRREFVTGVLASSLAIDAIAAQGHKDEHEHETVDGPLANATVSFGAWPSGLDRLTLPFAGPPSGPPLPNVHQLIPNTVTIKQGGNVNFIVAGFHNPVVYGPRSRPDTIDTSVLTSVPGAPAAFPKLIDDPLNRIYRGPNPWTLPFDRVEVVNFAKKGTHLVICAFVPHFDDGMYGWVKVV